MRCVVHYYNNLIVFLQSHILTRLLLTPVLFSMPPSMSNTTDLYLTVIVLSDKIISDAIRELSPTSAAEPDCLPSSLLVNCATELAPFLLIIFTHSLSSVPPSFERAAITPVFKSGDRSVPSNYRPISLTSDGGGSVDMVYLDFSKAFDKPDNDILLHKLKALGITGNLGMWFYNFLTNRSHFVWLPGGINADSPVLSGVPQGTVL